MAALTPLFVNGWKSTVQAGSSAIGSATATGINVASGDGAALGTIGTNQFIPMVVVDSSGTIKEYVWATARSTDTLTVTRQAEDSSRFAASTTSIQSGYTIYAVASSQGIGKITQAVPTPSINGMLGWTFDPALTQNGGQFGSGFVVLNAIAVPSTITITNVLMYVKTAGSGLTTGNVAGVYDSNGNLLASTGSQTTAWASTGLKTMSLTAPITVAGSTFIYLAFVNNGATTPQFAYLAAIDVLINAGSTAATGWRCAYESAGSRTALPATINMTTGTTKFQNAFWMGIS